MRAHAWWGIFEHISKKLCPHFDNKPHKKPTHIEEL
jgi:hypothetical protein